VCGIFGAVGAEVDREQLTTIHRLLHHRGPDDEGVVRTSGAVLLHQRLSIIDLSPGGHQPMASADGSVWITYNGEIYNYVELRRELEDQYAFRTRTDTEVILAAYQRWGDGCLERLRGMFAFGLWDEPRRRLLCATDRLSIKPLLYCVDGDRVIFSSEVKPLAAIGFELAPNRRMIYHYLRYGLLDHSEETLFEGVRQLRPGTYLTFENGRLDVRQYWDLGDEGDVEWRGERSETELLETLQEAVDLHLRGDVEPALSLSSGLDSNVLRALIQRDGRHRGLQCFTYCFTGTPYDECSRVRPLIEGAPIRHHATEVPSRDLLEGLASLIEMMEAPVGGLGIYGYWLNSRHVASLGLKVLLDGQGSDEGFAGYKYYYSQRLGALAARGDREALDAEIAAFGRVHGTPLRYPSPEFDALVRRDDLDALMKAPDGTSLASDYLHPDFVRRCGENPAPLPRPFADPVKTAMYQDLFYLKIPKLLRFQDRSAMAWSVEVRVPFLDHVLLEKLYRTPSEVLLAGGITKALLRKIGTTVLGQRPEEPKLYVAAPQREWIKGELAPRIAELIDNSLLVADGYVDREQLAGQYQDYRLSRELGNSFFVWKFVNLELWYRAFIRPGARRTAPLAATVAANRQDLR
jgi:asparagine synthase (glutamine-hydrolysing)